MTATSHGLGVGIRRCRWPKKPQCKYLYDHDDLVIVAHQIQSCMPSGELEIAVYLLPSGDWENVAHLLLSADSDAIFSYWLAHMIPSGPEH